MRSDITPGAVFPDYELSDHAAKRRKPSELQGPHPMILVLSRGGFCPKSLPILFVCASAFLFFTHAAKAQIRSVETPIAGCRTGRVCLCGF